MRILQVIHQFPPHSSQGSEVYCHQLSKLLVRSDEVAVFHISNIRPRKPERMNRGEFDGIRIYHCIDGGEYARVADWPNHFLLAKFKETLDEFKPEVVHFHNYLSLGDDLVGMAKERGTVVVYTLHDYGLICPNNLLLRTDGRLCGKKDGNFFQDCCPANFRISGGRKPLLADRLPSLTRWRMFADHYPHQAVRSLLRTGVSAAEKWFGKPETTDVERKRAFYLGRTRSIFRDVDLFIAPSDYLMQRYIACGMQADKVRFVRYGMHRFDPKPRIQGDDRLRFGYIGALHAHKGVHVLLEAFQGLEGLASLHIYGSAFGSPVSENHWLKISRQAGAGVTFHGRYENDRIVDILAGLDAVVVPSVWFENSPLTIQEAQIAGVPVITSDQGGMAELVRNGVDGLHFRLGDPQDLKAKLLSLIENQEMLKSMRSNMPEVPDMELQSRFVRQIYIELTEALKA